MLDLLPLFGRADPMPFGTLLVSSLALITGLMIALWLASLAKRDVSIVDIFWGVGFVLVAWWDFVLGRPATVRGLLVPILVTVWGLRLAGYLLWRKWGEAEDYRYREMREAAPDRFPWRSLFTVFLLQGLILWLVSFPLAVVAGATGPPNLTWLDGLALACFALGLFFEVVGDWQLARFKSDPANRGKVLDRGVWRYTRHPNYFGDAMVWWGLFLFAAATPGGWWTLFSPLLMTGLLLKVSGVALLEKKLATTKPAYRDYVERTSAFLPWPPRRG